jgi:serine/threonine protein kinase
MDYIPGGNLRELIKKFKYLPEDWVRFYAAELILAISHLHSLNVLYRDIKPHNVMIDSRGHLILIDFGLSKQEISHPRGALSLVGTPDYSAPEVLQTGVQQIEAHNRAKAQGKKKKHSKPKPIEDPAMSSTHFGYGKAADWWSLGIMIYEMLAGKPTFRGVDLRETYQRILYAKLEFSPEDRFSNSAKDLLNGLINRDPTQRLGAWDNPPRDIMDSPFFDGIEWDGIYERRQDGPLVPELPVFLQSRKSSVTKLSSAASPLKEVATDAHTDLESKPHENLLVFTPPPYHRVNDESKEPAITPATYINEGKEGQEEGDSSEEDSDEEAVIPGLRDSVFITSQGQNRLPDWSYIDEAVLADYLTQEAKGKEEGEKPKGEKRKKKTKSSEKIGEVSDVQDTEPVIESVAPIPASPVSEAVKENGEPIAVVKVTAAVEEVRAEVYSTTEQTKSVEPVSVIKPKFV